MIDRTTWTADELRILLSAASHDLRTPLTVIIGRASVLHELVRAELRRDLDAIVHQAHGLSYTFENLLAIIEATHDPTAREWVPLEELVGTVLVRLAAVSSGRSLRTAIPNNLLVHLHPARGELLIANLLRRAVANASPTAPLELHAKRTGAVVSFEVVVRHAELDAEPPQLPPDDRLTRADSLELAACHAIVSSYGGALNAGASPGGGIAFHVCIPDGGPLPDLGPAQEIM